MFKRIIRCHNCKSKPTLISQVVQVAGNNAIHFKLLCKNCGLEQFGYFTSKKEAFDAWNKQLNPSLFWDEPNKIKNSMRNKHENN